MLVCKYGEVTRKSYIYNEDWSPSFEQYIKDEFSITDGDVKLCLTRIDVERMCQAIDRAKRDIHVSPDAGLDWLLLLVVTSILYRSPELWQKLEKFATGMGS